MIVIGADVPSQRAVSSSLQPPAFSLSLTEGSVVFVQMDQQTIADYPVGGAATTPTFRYVYASYIDEPVVRKTAGTGGTLVYFHRIHQYSVTAITTSTGAIAERYAYTAYGQPTILNASGTPLSPQTSTLNSRYSYTGREWDATLGLHHFRARWMSPSAGRFLGRGQIGYVDSASVYSYVVSKPMSLVDPSGLVSITCTCMKYIRFPGEPAQQQIFTTEIECNELAASCCGTACKEQGGVFTRSWKQTDAEDDEVFSDEEVVDILDQSICNVFIVCDALPVTGGPTGECIPLCAGTKICCRAVKTCFKKEI